LTLLTVNVGSSSVRLDAFDGDGRRLAARHLDEQGGAAADPVAASALLHAFVRDADLRAIGAIAHRVVHGGERLTAACRIDAAVEAEIDRLSELAPLHNPPALAWIRAARAGFPGAAQIAAFDTAFFAPLPAVARTYAVPASWARRDALRRYGFHGLAHGFLWQRWTELRPRGLAPGAGGRVISLQLGSGCSVAAVRDGAPLDTSMGFSPLEGLVMGTRCGDVDPGLLLYLQRQHGWSARDLEQRLNHACGLLGVSASSADVKVLIGAGTDAARLALDLYCYRVRKYLGAYLAVLGGADAILFGGGVGEHVPALRARMLAGLEWAGIVLDPARNAAATGADAQISADASTVDLRVLAVDESAMLLREARAVLAAAA
jgi:acetate kinase